MTRSLDTPHGPIDLALDGKSDVTLVLGHGAGAGLDSDYMAFFARELGRRDIRVVRFNFPYMQAGRKAPDRQPILEETFALVAEHLRNAGALFLGGKSMGGRIASHIVASGTDTDGLVFLGYPLHPPGRPERLRTAHLREVDRPMLFVEGTRDPFCPLDTLERERKSFGGDTEVVVVDDGDHSLKVRKSSGRSTEDAWREAIDAMADWIAERA